MVMGTAFSLTPHPSTSAAQCKVSGSTLSSTEQNKTNQVMSDCWFTPIIPVLREPRQDELEDQSQIHRGPTKTQR